MGEVTPSKGYRGILWNPIYKESFNVPLKTVWVVPKKKNPKSGSAIRPPQIGVQFQGNVPNKDWLVTFT